MRSNVVCHMYKHTLPFLKRFSYLFFSCMNRNFAKPLGSETMIHDLEIYRLVLASDTLNVEWRSIISLLLCEPLGIKLSCLFL